MKTKRFEGATEKEVLEQIRDELGLSAIIISIKKKQKRGLFAFFKKPAIVITAAYEQEEVERDKLLGAAKAAKEEAAKNKQTESPGEILLGNIGNVGRSFDVPSSNPLEGKVVETEAKLAEALARLSAAERTAAYMSGRKYDNDKIQILYESLLGQGVMPEIAEKILADAVAMDTDDINILLKVVYNTIVGVLGEPRRLVGKTPSSKQPNIVVFMGSTGVGKTTTIAKLSSILLLNQHLRVGLITADTYRIAAVDQLKTYADILGLEMGVVYSSEEVDTHVAELKKVSDVILVDTAGRSHHNVENLSELKAMLERIPTSNKYLVLSATTRQEDLISIINTYDSITDFDLIFTKLDETGSLGVILNTCFLTGKSISYVTFGQNVPEDIGEIQPDKIAKTLMGQGLKDSYPAGGA